MGATTNAFSILGTVCRSGSEGLQFAEIVRDTGLAKASVHRLVRELVDLGALSLDSDSRRYSGGILLARLGSSVTHGFDLHKIAQPHLAGLQAKTGHVATFGTLQDGKGIYVAKEEPSGFGIKLHSEIGAEFPMHCTGMGKIMLAFGPEKTLDDLHESTLVRFTDKTITSKADLIHEIHEIKKQEFAFDAEEITPGLTCIAVPVLGNGATLLGAVSCTFLTSLEDADGQMAILGNARKTATAIADDIQAMLRR